MATRGLAAIGGLALVFFGMAVAPMLVAGSAPREGPVAPVVASPGLPAPAASDLALRTAIALRAAATAAADLERMERAIAALEATIPDLRGAGLAIAENELGLAKRAIAQERQDRALLDDALAHYRRALVGFEAAVDDEAAATVRWNLAIALQLKGEMSSDDAARREAADILRNLVANDDPALDRKAAYRNLGLILLAIGEADHSTSTLAESVVALEVALAGADIDGRDRLEWAETQNALATALQLLGEREWSLQRLEAALRARRNAWVLYESVGLETYRFYFDTRIAALEELIEARRTSPFETADRAAQ